MSSVYALGASMLSHRLASFAAILSQKFWK